MSKVIEIKDLHFAYDSKEVLCSVNLNIQKKDFFVLTGDNGSGKSTLIKLILNFLKPNIGMVKLHTHNIGYISQKGLQDYKDFPASVYEVVAMKIRESNFFNLNSKKIKSQVLKACQLVDIDSLIDKRISDLSGGQLQRVLIARELVCDLDLLILDEPTNGLDQKNIHNLMDLLSNLNKQGLTIGMVSHHLDHIHNNEIKVYRLEDTHLKEVENAFISI